MRRAFVLTMVISAVCAVAGLQWCEGQCMSYPVSLEERVQNSERIYLGYLSHKIPYKIAESGNIYTANIMKVTAWLKGHAGDSEVIVITEGGVLENEAMIVHPSLSLMNDHEYIIFLEGDNYELDQKPMRQDRPWMTQSRAYAAGQGAIIKQFDLYRDIYSEPVRDETGMFDRIRSLTGLEIRTPDGVLFEPRPYTGNEVISRSVNITSFSPNPTNAGTVAPTDFLTINGNNFGTTPGTIFYRNADNGGNSFVSSGVASDNVSWSNTQVVNKVAGQAGTGNIRVQRSDGTQFNSAGTLTVTYSHLEVNSNFFGFPAVTRQRVYLRNTNNQGGYTLTYNTTFNSNNAAVQSFERALDSWRCQTQVNFIKGGTTGTGSIGNDGINLVFFDSGLPNGVLGQCTSYYSGLGTSGCSQENTVWYLVGFDLGFRPNPTTSTTWNFGPGPTPSSQFDFETVALHELGHAHGLGHVINNAAVMHFAVSNGTDKRVLSASEEAGGSAKMAYSTQPTCLNPGGTSPMVPYTTSTCGFLSIELYSFDGYRLNEKSNQLNWSALENMESDYYRIQRSEDGIQFTDLAYVTAEKENGINVYSWTDHTAGTSPWYYRLAHTDLTSETEIYKSIFISGAEKDVQPGIAYRGGHLELTGWDAASEYMHAYVSTADGKILFQGPVINNQLFIAGNQLPNSVLLYQLSNGVQTFSGKIVVIN